MGAGDAIDTRAGLDTEHELLDALFAQAPVGLAFLDERLRFVRVNESLAEMTGVSAECHLGRMVTEVLPEFGPRLADVLAATLGSGRPRRDVELTGRLPADPGTTHHWLASTYVIPGDPARVGIVVSDITQRKRVEKERRRLLLLAREARERAEQAERRSAFLARAGKLLAQSLDHTETLASIARLAVPEIADWCFVEMLQEDGSIRRLAWAAADPGKEAIVAGYDARYPLDPEAPWGSPQVIRTGEPMLLERIPDEALESICADEEQLRVIRFMGFGAIMIVPLTARGRTFGDIAMVSAESGRTFDADDLDMAQELADRCALAVDNARLFASRGV